MAATIEELQIQVGHWHDQAVASRGGQQAGPSTEQVFTGPWSQEEASAQVLDEFGQIVRSKVSGGIVTDATAAMGQQPALANQAAAAGGGYSAWAVGAGGQGGNTAGGGFSAGTVAAAGAAGGCCPLPPAAHAAPRPSRDRNGTLELFTASGQPVKLAGEFEEHASGNEVITRRVKEQDKVVSPKFPGHGHVKQWHNQQGRNLVLAGGHSDEAEVGWWNEILREGSKFEDFAVESDPRFTTLSLKLTASLVQCIKEGNKTLASKVASSEDEAMNRGTLLKGRQLG